MPDSETPRVDTGLVRAHGLAALRTLMISLAFGILAAVQLLAPDLGAHFPWLTWGRLRYDHTQGIMFGWLGNAFFAFLYHAVPRAHRHGRSPACGWGIGSSASGISPSCSRAGCWCSPASASRWNGPSSRS